MTVLKPDTTLPVDVHGDLSLHGPSGNPIRIEAEGSRLQIVSPGWAEIRQMGPRSIVAQRRALKNTVRALKNFELTLRINVSGNRAFDFGAGVKTTWLARLLGLTSADIPFSSVLKLLRSPNANGRATIR